MPATFLPNIFVVPPPLIWKEALIGAVPDLATQLFLNCFPSSVFWAGDKALNADFSGKADGKDLALLSTPSQSSLPPGAC